MKHTGGLASREWMTSRPDSSHNSQAPKRCCAIFNVCKWLHVLVGPSPAIHLWQDSEKIPRLVNMNPDKSLEAGTLQSQKTHHTDRVKKLVRPRVVWEYTCSWKRRGALSTGSLHMKALFVGSIKADSEMKFLTVPLFETDPVGPP